MYKKKLRISRHCQCALMNVEVTKNMIVSDNSAKAMFRVKTECAGVGTAYDD